MHMVRRTHLYVGLFLFPWAILYGVTGFLFNHPTVLADAPTAHFSRADVVGTPLEFAPTPQEQATCRTGRAERPAETRRTIQAGHRERPLRDPRVVRGER
ncbi:hypothetical protein C1280_25300 [Gemmata obscuriglobus]|uniref:PepSY domain-containing protein n=2 Tax=Gemmata obscuriglobus TaxID=114 RepID=A0A2Z3H1T6_9BACT|nr:hypothetical protein C1280_25300 [Gemmata obscuriglobus]